MKNNSDSRGNHVAIMIRRNDGIYAEALVDNADMDVVAEYSGTWWIDQGHSTLYARGQITVAPRLRRMIQMHRLIMGQPVGLEIDHINGNGLDNRRANLRVVDKSANQLNRHGKAHARSSTGILGVAWSVSQRKWRARAKLYNKSIHLGYFDTIDGAIQARLSWEQSCAPCCTARHIVGATETREAA